MNKTKTLFIILFSSVLLSACSSTDYLILIDKNITEITNNTYQNITGINGTGTTGYISKFTNSNNIGNSVIYETSSDIGIGTTTPNAKLEISDSVFPVGSIIRTTTLTGGTLDSSSSGVASGYSLRTTTTNDMTDGFGGGIILSVEDNSSSTSYVQGVMGRILARRDGSDTTGLMQFFTGGTNAVDPTMTLRNSGNVGIGTTAPASRLNIVGATTVASSYSNISLLEGAGSAAAMADLELSSYRGVGTGSGHFLIQSWRGDAVRTTTEELILNGLGGNVGIGTTTPSRILDVRGNSNSTSTVGGLLLNLRNTASSFNNHVSGMVFETVNTTGATQTAGYIQAQGNTGLHFGAGSTTRQMTLSSTGRVGINTTSPSFTLDVVGTGLINGGVGVASTGTFQVRQRGNTVDDGIALTSSSATAHRIWKDVNGTFNIGTSSSPSILTATTAGAVGIGTANPTARLDIRGGGGGIEVNLVEPSGGAAAQIYFNNTVRVWEMGADSSPDGFYIHRQASGTQAAFFISSSDRVGINTTTPTHPLTVNANVSGVSIWALANVSATGYITRTTVYDKSKGSAMDLIKDADALKTAGKIDHEKFYGYTEYTVTDYTRPVETITPVEVCDTIENVDEKTEEKTTKKECRTEYSTTTTYPYTKVEKGVSLNEEIDLLRQAIYEMKVETCAVQRGAYSWC
jgi:hypothetical protein